jgi:hypothetical protein
MQQRFKIGDLIKTDLGEVGIVEKVEEHIILKSNEFAYVYYIRMFHDGCIDIWYYDDKLYVITS